MAKCRLESHPFRGFIRALTHADTWLAVFPQTGFLAMMEGLMRLAFRPEWADNIVCLGPHLRIAKFLGPAFWWATVIVAVLLFPY